MALEVLAVSFGATAASILLVAPLMYAASAFTRVKLTESRPYSRFPFTIAPALVELFIAATFAASMTGVVRWRIETRGGMGEGWLWATGLLCAVLPGILRWTADFLADPGADPPEIPEWLEVPVLQAAIFLLFAARPEIVRSVWGWAPFAQGASHPLWASAAVVCAASGALIGLQIWSRRRIPFVASTRGSQPPRALAAGAGR